jgi:hypothetical protein
MADPDQPTENVTQDMGRIIDRVMEELDGRLGVALSDPDRLAVGTAVAKATWRGVLTGIATMAYRANADWAAHLDRIREVAPNVDWPDAITHPSVHGEEPDVWAERYGGAAEDDS